MGRTSSGSIKLSAIDNHRGRQGKRGQLLVEERPTTKALLIDVGEELFGLYGLDGISLREIATSAGQANANVVQYHFKDKLGLIRAIIEDRNSRREQLRRAILDRLVADGTQNSPRDLLAAILLPVLAFRSDRSGYIFCRFLLQCYLHQESGFDESNERYEALRKKEERKKKEDRSALMESVELLQWCLKDFPPSIVVTRLKVVHLMFLSCVVGFDNARASGKRSAEFDPEPILDMALAALLAPLRKAEKTASSKAS